MGQLIDLHRAKPYVMSKLVMVLVVVLLVGVGGMAVFLALWEPPMPPGTVEIPIPNDRLSLQ
jgi:hypothetical protein